jgi:hypothetical protein
LELYQKIYVKPSFLDTEHGKLACTTCHGGDSSDPDWRTAHEKVVRDPTYPDPSAVCGECHEETAANAANSLHYTLNPMRRILAQRTSDPDNPLLATAFDRHCQTCHASCGQCHVSRPNSAGGGFLAGHNFAASPPMDITCASCHGGRVHNEYTGADDDDAADVHYEEEEMACRDCHSAEGMHADATTVSSRHTLPQRPACRDCHEGVLDEGSGNRFHEIHGERLACQVCHALESKHCFNCHAGTDKKGLPWFTTDKSRRLLKIGRNPEPSADDPSLFVQLRHVPVSPKLFAAYGENLLDRCDRLPTWKRSATHRIRRITPQTKDCNSCHGNRDLFLSTEELADWEKAANRDVVVADEEVPPLIPDP